MRGGLRPAARGRQDRPAARSKETGPPRASAAPTRVREANRTARRRRRAPFPFRHALAVDEPHAVVNVA